MEKENEKKRGNYKSEEQKRNQNILIRVTSDEKNRIEKNANRAGKNVSDFTRDILLNGVVFSPPQTEQKTEEKTPEISSHNLGIDKRTFLGLANNLNQLTKYTHQTKELDADLHNTIKLIQQLMIKITQNI